MGNLGSPKLTGNRTEFIRWAGPDWPPPPIEAIPNSPAAVITYLDDADAVLTDADTNTDTLDVALDPGLNIVKIKVQSGDNSAETTYTLRLIRVQGVPEEIDSVPELHRNITVDVLPHARGFHNSRGTAGSTNFGNRRFRITPLTYQVRAILAVDRRLQRRHQPVRSQQGRGLPGRPHAAPAQHEIRDSRRGLPSGPWLSDIRHPPLLPVAPARRLRLVAGRHRARQGVRGPHGTRPGQSNGEGNAHTHRQPLGDSWRQPRRETWGTYGTGTACPGHRAGRKATPTPSSGPAPTAPTGKR